MTVTSFCLKLNIPPSSYLGEDTKSFRRILKKYYLSYLSFLLSPVEKYLTCQRDPGSQILEKGRTINFFPSSFVAVV
jgi:hypothetical protein